MLTGLRTFLRQISCSHRIDGVDAIAPDDRGVLIDLGRRKMFGCTRCGGKIII